MKNLINEIGKIKSDRNLFIHGLWELPYESENDIKIVCGERNLKYDEHKDKEGNIIEQKWTSNKKHIFWLSYIKKQIRKIEDILVSQNYLINELETKTFF
jgi:hypothetical protein